MMGRMTLAIDPGPLKSGYVVMDRGRLVESGWTDNRELRDIIRQGRCNVAIEMIASYGMAVGASVFATCVQIGQFVEAADSVGVAVKLIFRKDVKMFVCRSMKAKDGNIRQSLIDHIGAVGTKKNPGPLYGVKSHAWAALALAVTAVNDCRMPGYVGHTPAQDAHGEPTNAVGTSRTV